MPPISLTIDQHINDKRLLLIVTGHVNGVTILKLREPLMTACEYAITRRIIFDFRDVLYLSSEGLSLLAKAGRQLTGIGRPLFVSLTTDSQPERVLHISQLPNLLLITSSRAAEIGSRAAEIFNLGLIY